MPRWPARGGSGRGVGPRRPRRAPPGRDEAQDGAHALGHGLADPADGRGAAEQGVAHDHDLPVGGPVLVTAVFVVRELVVDAQVEEEPAELALTVVAHVGSLPSLTRSTARRSTVSRSDTA